MCINYDKVQVYGIFNLTPFIPQLVEAAQRKYNNLPIDWRATVYSVRESLTCAVATHCGVHDDTVLIDVLTEAPKGRSRVYGVHGSATAVLQQAVNAGNVEQHLQFIPQWGIA